jgi:SAM-dependent methyltransferase
VALSSRPATTDTYFQDVWSTGDDPWDHAGRWYEQRKYDLTVAAVPVERWSRSFEPGCGTGVLTRMLAARADEHLAMERHPRGVEATRRRAADRASLTVVQGAIPYDWPDGTFDLIVLSEVLYYLSEVDLRDALRRTRASLRPGGHLVAVHYRPDVDEHTWNGDEVHDVLAAEPGWRTLTHVVDDEFRLDALAVEP